MATPADYLTSLHAQLKYQKAPKVDMFGEKSLMDQLTYQLKRIRINNASIIIILGMLVVYSIFASEPVPMAAITALFGSGVHAVAAGGKGDAKQDDKLMDQAKRDKEQDAEIKEHGDEIKGIKAENETLKAENAAIKDMLEELQKKLPA